MQNNTSSVQSLSATGSSRVQVGNNYNTTNYFHQNTDQDDIARSLAALGSTDPRLDKARIEQTGGDLWRDSYKWILDNDKFLAWRDKGNSNQLLWVKGDPGKGKTMLLCGVINELLPSTTLENPENRIPLSYFFCQATNSGLNNCTAVLRGLIYLLVIQQPCLLSHLHDRQEHNQSHWNSRVAMEEIFHKMIADPALQEVYMVVDALDECLDDLNILLALISSTSSRVKWLVSSRNRCEIEEHLGQIPSRLPLSLELHQECVSQAVMSYIHHRTAQLRNRKRLRDDTAQQVQVYLSRHAHGTFLWVALVCQQLERCRAWEISKQLREIEFPEGLTELFARMINQILESRSRELYIKLLAIASTVFRPVTIPELVAMAELTLDEEMLPDLIAECGSFLTLKDNTLFFIHQSAKDFLLTKSGALLFKPSLSRHHYNLYQRSIVILQSLRPDMYGLVHPGVSIEEAIRNRPTLDPLNSLEYACVFWADHLKEAHELFSQDGVDEESPCIEAAHRFIADKFLFWLEALSLCKNLSAAARALWFLEPLPCSFSQSDHKALVNDSLRFFLFFRPVIEDHPLQTYASGLLFSPRESLIRQRFNSLTPDIFATAPQLDATWSPIWSAFDCESSICTVGFSPTSQILVTISRGSELVKWVVKDGSQDGKFKYVRINRATLSPNLKWSAVVTEPISGPETLQVRDLRTNSVLWTRGLGINKIRGIELSPDSRWLAACYQEKLELYALEGGVDRVWPLQRDPYSCLISFSSDSAFVVIVGYLHTVQVLDLRSGQQYESPSQDSIRINYAKFVPHTHTVMLCTTWHGVCLWDIPEQKFEDLAFFDGNLTCLAFPNNESWVAIAAGEKLLLYDHHQRTLLQQVQVPSPRTKHLCTIAISPNDQKIAMSVNSTLCLLDVPALLAMETCSQQQEDKSAYFSDDGQLIASVFDTKIEVLDATTCKVLSSLSIRGLAQERVSAVAFSPKGQQIAFRDRSDIFVWNFTSDSLQQISQSEGSHPLLAISDETSRGSQLVVASDSFDGLSVWDITTGKLERTIKPPDQRGQGPGAVTSSGIRLGVAWYLEEDVLFVLYNIETGQQISRCDLLSHFGFLRNECRIFLASNGKFLLSRLGHAGDLSYWGLETGIHHFRIPLGGRRYLLLDDFTVASESAVYCIDSILASTMDNPHGLNFNNIGLALHYISTKYPGTPEYSWITFDNEPLLWVPRQYRPNDASLTAIGLHHVTIECPSGMYSISFRTDVRDLLKRTV